MAYWLGTELDIKNRVMTQIMAAAELETRISDAKEENKYLLREKIKDQQAAIGLQENSL